MRGCYFASALSFLMTRIMIEREEVFFRAWAISTCKPALNLMEANCSLLLAQQALT